ncbi:SAM-dependent methyltransferase [Devosia sp. I507]|nr:SAM-dependent methyltransferase [Devosia sp. I507]
MPDLEEEEMAEAMRFQDGESYESMMGVWSALVGAPFLDWLNISTGAKWADVGCGNGASTELIVGKAKPALVEAIDPSDAQLAYARKRHQAGLANYTLGSALDLPYPDGAFDVAIMALVLFFVPEPARGVAEMRRVVRGGGSVAAYAWDLEGGGFPYEDVHVALIDAGVGPLLPPHPEVARLDELKRLWTDAGLVDVETREITASRAFPSFDAYWLTAASSPGIGQVLSKLGPEQVEQIRKSAQGSRRSGELVVQGRAHAVRGRVAG